MLFATPHLEGQDDVVALIDELRHALRRQVAEPRRWTGSLRRRTFARAVQGSNSIEGYVASLDDVVAAVEGEETLDATTETRRAIEGYRDALTYVLQLGHAGDVSVDESLIRSLHFMMLKYDLSKNPGRWRPGAVYVRREEDGEIVYEGPGGELVPGLVAELVDGLRDDDSPGLIRAAMAHLNLVMIHPFSDGNGRMARCLQTLVLAHEQVLSPVFNSIEEYLGRNTPAYYDVLAVVGGGRYRPERDAGPWVRFCLTAHYRQARTLLRRVDESEQLWDRLTALVTRHEVPPRAVGALFDAAIGFRLRNSGYRSAVEASEGTSLSDQTAGRDLRTLVDAGLLDPHGERRGRFYTGAPVLRAEWAAIRERRQRRSEDDPFEIVRDRAQTRLPI